MIRLQIDFCLFRRIFFGNLQVLLMRKIRYTHEDEPHLKEQGKEKEKKEKEKEVSIRCSALLYIENIPRN